MKRIVLTTMAVLCLCMWLTPDTYGRGGRGGGGGARAAAGRTPSMSRPAAMSRPSGGGYAGMRPGGGGAQFNRPQGNRPSLGSLPNPSRPGSGISQRPGASGGPSFAQRPGGGTRPGAGARPSGPGSSTRPAFAGGRPSQGQLDDFLELGGTGSRPSFSRPTGPGRPGSSQVAGGAAADFLRDRPSPGRPGDGVRPATFERPSIAARPARPGGDGRPGFDDLAGGDRPARPGGGSRPGDRTRPSRPGQGGGGEQLRPGDGNRPGRPGGDGDRPGRPGNRPDWAHRPNHRPDRRPDWDRWQNWHQNQWTNVNKFWNDNWGHYHRWFDGDWCHHHPYWHWNPGFNYWAWATWPVVTSWFPWGWTQPVYYNYGNNVYYEDDMVYYGTTPVATAADYAYQAEQIATSIPPDPPPADSWMSLGVFAVMPDGEAAGAEPTMFLQLAVSKQGVIAGTLQNTVSGTTKNIEGMVDRETQRAAWTEVGQTRPIMETGIGNLTQDTASTLVHFADGTTQQWLLVRMDAPPQDGAAGAATSRTPPQ